MTNETTYRKLTISEFARRVNYSRRQITRYIESGKLIPRRSLGGLPYFLESDVEKFLNYKPSKIVEPLDLTVE